MEDLVLFLIIFIISIIQCIFGVGVLIFGTPSLILLDYSFVNTLNILLPCSLIINFGQIISIRNKFDYKKYKEEFFIYCLIFIVIALFLTTIFFERIDLKKFIGLSLLFILISQLVVKKEIFFKKINSKLTNVIIGIIHGSTNLGGPFLAFYINSITNDVESRRYLTGYSYFYMVSIQLVTLLITNNLFINKIILICCIITILTFLSINRVIKKISNTNFDILFNILIFIYIIMLFIS